MNICMPDLLMPFCPIGFVPNLHPLTSLWSLCLVQPILLKWVPQQAFQHLHARLADALLPNWVCSEPAPLDFTVVSLLGSTHIVEVGTTAGLSAEERKHDYNDQKCCELICNGCGRRLWSLGLEAKRTFSRMAIRLAVKRSMPKSQALSSLTPG